MDNDSNSDSDEQWAIERMQGETYPWDGETYAVYRYSEYEEWSVLAGQQKRSFITSSTDIAALKAEFPHADDCTQDNSGTPQVPVHIPVSAPAWFDPADAGETWSEDDY